MKKNPNKPADDDMRPEYDLRGGVRGKYYERYKQGTNVVLLDPDVAKVFRDSSTVNEALRRYLSEHGAPPTTPADANRGLSHRCGRQQLADSRDASKHLRILNRTLSF